MSGDAEWIMCCTTSGKLYVYRRHHRHHQQQLSKGGGVGSSPQVDPYILNQVSRAVELVIVLHVKMRICYDSWYSSTMVRVNINSWHFFCVACTITTIPVIGNSFQG